MAYGNWGAFVYKNNERAQDHEDAIPYHETDLPSGSLLVLTARTEHRMAHHAVLGSGRIRWCGHKSTPVLYVDGAMVDGQEMRKQYASPVSADADGYIWETKDTLYQGEIDGYKFKAKPFSGNMLDLELVDPDGTKWTARSGYAYGNYGNGEGNKMYAPTPWNGEEQEGA